MTTDAPGPLTEPVRRRHDDPCPECEGTDAILHGGRVLECRDCGWEWAYAGRRGVLGGAAAMSPRKRSIEWERMP